jgi:hypothetical protein
MSFYIISYKNQLWYIFQKNLTYAYAMHTRILIQNELAPKEAVIYELKRED